MSCLPDPTFAPVRQTSKSKVLYRQILTRGRRCRCRSRHNRPRRARYREAVRPWGAHSPPKGAQRAGTRQCWRTVRRGRPPVSGPGLPPTGKVRRITKGPAVVIEMPSRPATGPWIAAPGAEETERRRRRKPRQSRVSVHQKVVGSKAPGGADIFDFETLYERLVDAPGSFTGENAPCCQGK